MAGGHVLLAIGFQAGFLSRDYAPHPAHEALSITLELARRCRDTGVPVIAARMVEGAPSQRVARMMPLLRQPLAPGWDRIDDTLLGLCDAVVDYRGWDVMRAPGLAQRLDALGARHLILTGLGTNFAVESTGRSAWEAGLSVTYVAGAVTSITADLHDFAVEHVLPRTGFVLSLDEIAKLFFTANRVIASAT